MYRGGAAAGGSDWGGGGRRGSGTNGCAWADKSLGAEAGACVGVGPLACIWSGTEAGDRVEVGG